MHADPPPSATPPAIDDSAACELAYRGVSAGKRLVDIQAELQGLGATSGMIDLALQYAKTKSDREFRTRTITRKRTGKFRTGVLLLFGGAAIIAGVMWFSEIAFGQGLLSLVGQLVKGRNPGFGILSMTIIAFCLPALAGGAYMVWRSLGIFASLLFHGWAGSSALAVAMPASSQDSATPALRPRTSPSALAANPRAAPTAPKGPMVVDDWLSEPSASKPPRSSQAPSTKGPMVVDDLLSD